MKRRDETKKARLLKPGVGAACRRAILLGSALCLIWAGCASVAKEAKPVAAQPVNDLFRGYAGAEWNMSPSEIKAVYSKYRVVEEEKSQDFGRERHRLVLESDRIRREFVFERRTSQLVVRSITVTWTVWDEVKFASLRTGLSGKWGEPHDSKDVFGVAYDKWEFDDIATGAKVHATLLAPRQPLLGYARAGDPGSPPGATPAGAVTGGAINETQKEGVPQYGEALPPSLSILFADRRPKPRGSDQGSEGRGALAPAASGSGER